MQRVHSRNGVKVSGRWSGARVLARDVAPARLTLTAHPIRTIVCILGVLDVRSYTASDVGGEVVGGEWEQSLIFLGLPSCRYAAMASGQNHEAHIPFSTIIFVIIHTHTLYVAWRVDSYCCSFMKCSNCVPSFFKECIYTYL